MNFFKTLGTAGHGNTNRPKRAEHGICIEKAWSDTTYLIDTIYRRVPGTIDIRIIWSRINRRFRIRPIRIICTVSITDENLKRWLQYQATAFSDYDGKKKLLEA